MTSIPGAEEQLIKWSFKPYKGVFPSHGSLANVPGGLDHISKKGCRAQPSSSWACSSLSYIALVARGNLDPTSSSAGQKCSGGEEDVLDRGDVEASAKSTKIPIYGLQPSAKFLDIITDQQKTMLLRGRLHYIDHMVLGCKTWDMYHTMSTAEKLLYHCHNVVDYFVDEYKYKLVDANRLIYGMENAGPDAEYVDDANAFIGPPTTKYAQGKLVKFAEMPAVDKNNRKSHEKALDNALSLSLWLHTLSLRHVLGQSFTEKVDKLAHVDIPNKKMTFEVNYFDFRSRKAGDTQVLILAQRVKDSGLVHCKHSTYTNAGFNLQYIAESDPDCMRKSSKSRTGKNKVASFDFVCATGKVPIRYTTVTNVPTMYERINKNVTTPTFNSLAEKVEERTQVGSLGALVKRSMIRDPASVLSIIKTLMGEPASAMDIAVLTRMMLMIMSLDLSSTNIDLTPYQFYRNYLPEAHSIQIVEKKVNKPIHCMAMFLDDFIDYIAGTLNMPMINNLLPQSIDKTWIAIPITNEILMSRALIPYTISFLDSKITNGSINWIFRGEVTNVVTSGEYHQGMLYVSIPASNTVIIPGVYSFVYVLVDQHDMRDNNLLEHVLVNGNQVNVYNRFANAPFDPTNFAPFFEQYYTHDNYQLINTDYNRAYSYFMKKNNLRGVQQMAMAMCAEFRNAFKPGMFLKPSQIHGLISPSNYCFSNNSGGAWFVNNSDDMKATSMSKRATISCLAGSLDSWINYCHVLETDLINMVRGYNNASLSSWHLCPDGHWATENSETMVHGEIPNQRFAEHIGEHNAYVPGYTISQSTSLHRLATMLGLYERDVTPIVLVSNPSVTAWTHMHSIAVAASTSLYLVSTCTSLHYWSGIGTLRHDSFMYTKLRQQKEHIFLGVVHHSDTYTTLSDLVSNEEIFADLHFYYDWDPSNAQFYASSPIPIGLFIQWYKKTISREYSTSPNSVWFTFNGLENSGYMVDDNKCLERILAAVTTDIIKYIPITVVVGDDKGMLGAWFENISRLTTGVTDPHIATHEDAFQTFPSTISNIDLYSVIVDPRRMYICASTSEKRDADLLTVTVTDLDWPDPPEPIGQGDNIPPSGELPPKNAPEDGHDAVAQETEMKRVADLALPTDIGATRRTAPINELEPEV